MTTRQRWSWIGACQRPQQRVEAAAAAGLPQDPDRGQRRLPRRLRAVDAVGLLDSLLGLPRRGNRVAAQRCAALMAGWSRQAAMAAGQVQVQVQGREEQEEGQAEEQREAALVLAAATQA